MENIPSIQMTDNQRQALTIIADKLNKDSIIEMGSVLNELVEQSHEQHMEELDQLVGNLSESNRLSLMYIFQDVIPYYQQRIKVAESLIDKLAA